MSADVSSTWGSLRDMAVAWATPGQSLYQETGLLTDIVAGLEDGCPSLQLPLQRIRQLVELGDRETGDPGGYGNPPLQSAHARSARALLSASSGSSARLCTAADGARRLKSRMRRLRMAAARR